MSEMYWTLVGHHPLEARPLEHGLVIRKVAPLCQINNDSDRSVLY